MGDNVNNKSPILPIPLLSNLCHFQQVDTCLHLLSCCTNISILFVLIDTTKHYMQLQTPSSPTLHLVTKHSSMPTHIIIIPHKIHYHHGYYLGTIFCHAANVWHTLDQIFFASKANHLSTIFHSPLLPHSPYNSWNIVQWQILEHCHYWKTLKLRHLASPSSLTRLNALSIITIIADICGIIHNSMHFFWFRDPQLKNSIPYDNYLP